MAQQMLADFYGCDKVIIDDIEKVREIAHKMCEELNTEIVEECCHKFMPVGITYMAVITTSHFSVHTWPENGYAAVDIFSCSEGIPERIVDEMANFFSAKNVNTRIIERIVE